VLEIFLLIHFGRKLAGICSAKGRSAWPWVLMMVVVYFGAMIGGVVVATIVSLVLDPNIQEPDLLLMLVCGYGSAAVALTLLFLLVRSLPDNNARRHDDYDDYEDDRYEDDRHDDDDRPQRGRPAERYRDGDDRYNEDDDRRDRYDR
jgi:hypothetical protein